MVEEVHRAHDGLEEEDGLHPHLPVHEGDHGNADKGRAKEGVHLVRGEGKEGRMKGMKKGGRASEKKKHPAGAKK